MKQRKVNYELAANRKLVRTTKVKPPSDRYGKQNEEKTATGIGFKLTLAVSAIKLIIDDLFE